MNQHALAALEFPRVRDEVRARLASPAGELAAREWGPRGVAAVVERLVEETAQMRSFLEEGRDLSLAGLILPDELLAKARPEGAFLTPAECCAVRRLCQVNRLARAALLPHGERYPLLATAARALPGLHELEKMIDGMLDGEGEFLDAASSQLRSLRGNIAATRERISSLYRGLLARHAGDGIFQDDIIATRGGRYVLLVRTQARSRLPGMVLDRTDSGQALYLEPREATEINNHLQELNAEAAAEEHRLLLVMTEGIRAQGEALVKAAAVLGGLDLIRARALYGIPRRHVRPVFSTAGELRLRKGRHPLLEAMEGRAPVPLDLELVAGQRALVVTGPNTGGKTVVLKTVGLLALMAQAGLFIPAQEGSSLPLFGDLFADIGDEQSLEQSLSTFSAHIRNIAEALRQAGGDSLVILDELGAGTDPAEGAPLAMAVVEYLLERGARVLASTHHGSLVAFVSGVPGAVNASMEFDERTLRPTYRLQMGIPGRSHAREVARHMGVPEEVIRRSREHGTEGGPQVAGLLAELERGRRDQERAVSGLKEREERLAGVLRERERELEVLRRGREDAIRSAREEALSALARAKEEVRRIVSQAGERRGKAEGELKGLRRDIDRELPSPRREVSRPLAGPPSVGQRVSLPGTGCEGTVAEIDAARGTARVEMRGKMVDIPLSGLQEPAGIRGVSRSPSASFAGGAPEGARNLDIRGFRTEDAGTLVVQFLDRAWLTGIDRVEILHGKGEGRLKDLVFRLAAMHPGVGGIEAAPEERGGAGITVINFR